MFQLQKDISESTQEIKDLFNLASLNLSAVDLVSKTKCMKFQQGFQKVIDHYQQFQSLRLQQFIKHQIYLEGEHQRTDRMKDYEDKIQIQRRLITDKQTNYLGLFKKKTLMSLSISPEDYAYVQMNKRRIEKQSCIEYYKNDLVTLNQIKIKLEQTKVRKEQELEKLKKEKTKLDRLKLLNEEIASDPYQYSMFVNEQTLNQKPSKPDYFSNLQIQNNKLTAKYLKQLKSLLHGNQDLKNRLNAKSSFSNVLLKENQELKLKLSNVTQAKALQLDDKQQSQSSFKKEYLSTAF